MKQIAVVFGGYSGETKISFKPDGIRPIYCRDCLSLARIEKRQKIELRKQNKQLELKKIKDEEDKAVKTVKSQEENKITKIEYFTKIALLLIVKH